MNELTKDPDLGGPPGPRPSQRMPWWPAALIVIALLAALVAYFWLRKGAEPEVVVETPAPEAAAPVAAAAEETPPAPAWDLPPLEESDDFLRDVAARLSSHPEWLAWIATDDLVRRFVAAVDEVARGELPAAQLAFLSPKRGFPTPARGAATQLGAESFQRYTRLAAVVSGIDARGAVDLYRRLEPLLERAYRDLGYPDAHFERTLAKAVKVVLDTPDPGRTLNLEPALRSYKFVDPELESLPAVQKLLLRMGPENAAAVKRKLREIARELDRSDVASQAEGS